MDCLFCKIIEGTIPSKTIYEDEKVKVILDINPSANGHCLMIPKKHIEVIEEVTDDLATHMLMVTKKINQLLKEKLGIEKIAIAQIGQDVNHFHVHLIPQYLGDHWKLDFNKEKPRDIEETYNKIMN